MIQISGLTQLAYGDECVTVSEAIRRKARPYGGYANVEDRPQPDSEP